MTYIGICGYANSGKDFLCEVLSHKYKSFRLALADHLKQDLRQACIEKYGIDPVTCSRQQKNIIRDFLVSSAKDKRLSSKGTYFTSFADSIIERDKIEYKYDFIIIPDIRYAFYENDEAQWIKSKNGILINCERSGVFAPNAEEEIHYPAVKKLCDFTVQWPEFNFDKIENGLDFLNKIGIIKELDERLRACI